MPSIVLTRGWKAVIHSDEHNPPHVHLVHAADDLCAVFTVPTLSPSQGDTGKVPRRVLEEAVQRMDEIVQLWERSLT